MNCTGAALLAILITANGKRYRVIGVRPAGFQWPAFWGGFDQKKPKMWMPVDLHAPAEQEEHFSYFVFGRLRPGVQIGAARSEVSVIAQRLAAAQPDKNAGLGVNVYSIAEENAGPELIATFASYVPALRAARVDPIQALRAE